MPFPQSLESWLSRPGATAILGNISATSIIDGMMSRGYTQEELSNMDTQLNTHGRLFLNSVYECINRVREETKSVGNSDDAIVKTFLAPLSAELREIEARAPSLANFIWVGPPKIDQSELLGVRSLKEVKHNQKINFWVLEEHAAAYKALIEQFGIKNVSVISIENYTKKMQLSFDDDEKNTLFNRINFFKELADKKVEKSKCANLSARDVKAWLTDATHHRVTIVDYMKNAIRLYEGGWIFDADLVFTTRKTKEADDAPAVAAETVSAIENLSNTPPTDALPTSQHQILPAVYYSPGQDFVGDIWFLHASKSLNSLIDKKRGNAFFLTINSDGNFNQSGTLQHYDKWVVYATLAKNYKACFVAARQIVGRRLDEKADYCASLVLRNKLIPTIEQVEQEYEFANAVYNKNTFVKAVSHTTGSSCYVTNTWNGSPLYTVILDQKTSTIKYYNNSHRLDLLDLPPVPLHSNLLLMNNKEQFTSMLSHRCKFTKFNIADVFDTPLFCVDDRKSFTLLRQTMLHLSIIARPDLSGIVLDHTPSEKIKELIEMKVHIPKGVFNQSEETETEPHTLLTLAIKLRQTVYATGDESTALDRFILRVINEKLAQLDPTSVEFDAQKCMVMKAIIAEDCKDLIQKTQSGVSRSLFSEPSSVQKTRQLLTTVSTTTFKNSSDLLLLLDTYRDDKEIDTGYQTLLGQCVEKITALFPPQAENGLAVSRSRELQLVPGWRAS